MSKVFELTDTKGNKFEVGEDVIQAIAKQAVPDGSVVIPQTDLAALQTKNTDLEGKVTNLSSQVEVMAKATEASEKRARTIQLSAKLDAMSKSGFITKPQRDYAATKFAESVDLTDFDAWAACFTTPVVKLNTETGSGLTGGPSDAGARLLDLAQKIQKEERMDLRSALIKASAQDPKAAEEYREQFDTNAVH